MTPDVKEVYDRLVGGIQKNLFGITHEAKEIYRAEMKRLFKRLGLVYRIDEEANVLHIRIWWK